MAEGTHFETLTRHTDYYQKQKLHPVANKRNKTQSKDVHFLINAASTTIFVVANEKQSKAITNAALLRSYTHISCPLLSKTRLYVSIVRALIYLYNHCICAILKYLACCKAENKKNDSDGNGSNPGEEKAFALSHEKKTNTQKYSQSLQF